VATFQLDSASLAQRTPHGIPRSLHNVTATTRNTEKVAAVVQRQNAQHRSVLLRVLHDCYFVDRCGLCSHLTYLANADIACVAAVPFLGLQSPGTATIVYSRQCGRGFRLLG